MMELACQNKLGHWATLGSIYDRYDLVHAVPNYNRHGAIVKAISPGRTPVNSFGIPKPPPDGRKGGWGIKYQAQGRAT